MDIKPIETYYNGYRFRSRLEARWAVFFDVMGIRYEYEPEGFCMSGGERYLPDFFLPDFNYYAEVKGQSENLMDDIKKMKQFILGKKTALIILSSIPYDPQAKGLFWFPIQYYTARSGGCVDGCRACFFKFEDERPNLCDDFYIGCRQEVHLYENSMFSDHDEFIRLEFEKMQAVSGAKEDDDEVSIKDSYEKELEPVELALIKARQARFEHGETPRT